MNRILLSLVFLIVTVLSVPSAVMSADGQVKKTGKKISENQCLKCHIRLKSRLKKPVSEWNKSVHAKVGNSCSLCHGGNPLEADMKKAKSSKYKFTGKPDEKQITDFCGRGGCHNTSLNQFKKGPHYKSVLEKKHPNCTDCHGSHNIQKSSLDIIKPESCTGCHSEKYSREIISSINSIEKGIDRLQTDMDYLAVKRIPIEKIYNRLDNTKHLFHQLVHVFSREDIKSTKRIVELEIENLKSDVRSKVDLSKRLELLYMLMFVISTAIIAGFIIYSFSMYLRRR